MRGHGSYLIVVAEDDERFLNLVATTLEADGRFEVEWARNGREAVQLANRLQPDAIVMDIEMPELDGVEATRRLLELAPEIPVVAISGSDYEERVLEIRQAGAVDYVRKSRVDCELVQALEALLDSRRCPPL